MDAGHEFGQAQIAHFLAGIAARSTAGDTPVAEVISSRYHDNTDAYIRALLRFDPETLKYLEPAPHRAAKPAGPGQGTPEDGRMLPPRGNWDRTRRTRMHQRVCPTFRGDADHTTDDPEAGAESIAWEVEAPARRDLVWRHRWTRPGSMIPFRQGRSRARGESVFATHEPVAGHLQS